MSTIFRSSPPKAFFGKGVLKIYKKFIAEHPCQSVISIKLFCDFKREALTQVFSCKFFEIF